MYLPHKENASISLGSFVVISMGPMHISKKLHLVLLARFVVESKQNLFKHAIDR